MSVDLAAQRWTQTRSGRKFDALDPDPDDLDDEMPAEVHQADGDVLLDEARELMKPLGPEWDHWFATNKPAGSTIVERPWREVRDAFLDRFHELGGR